MNVLEIHILGLILHEPTIEDGLSLLTEIGLTTKNESIWKACEYIRSKVCDLASGKQKDWTSNSLRDALNEREPFGSFLLKDNGDENNGVA